MPDAPAAETEGAAAPHTDRSPHLHPQLAHDRPVAQPAVVGNGLPPAGWPGRKPVRPAGQRTSQARGEFTQSGFSTSSPLGSHVFTVWEV